MNTYKYKYPVVLSIAGSDSGGGAGIQADLKTFSALGCFGTTAITAITVQNTLGVSAIHSIPAPLVAGQIQAVMDDIQPTAVKIGMIHSAELANIVGNTLRRYPGVPVVLDPVMVATSGDKLMQDDTIAALRCYLFPLAKVITPNLDEAAILSGLPVTNVEDMKIAAQKILADGPYSILLKGGHLTGPTLYDVYATAEGEETIFETTWIDSHNVHGTGCTLSSAIAAYLALDHPLLEAIILGRRFIHSAIENGKDVLTGSGHGPLNHFFDPQTLIKHELE